MNQSTACNNALAPVGYRRRLAALASAAILAAAALAGCGSGAETTGSTTTSAAAKAALDKAYKGIGGDLSGLTPVAPKAGVTFYAISCGESSTSCVVPAHALVDAAKAAGWNAHLADGKLNPAGFAAAIRQAVAGGADVIVPVGFPCSTAQAAFKEARDAGVTVVGGGGPDDCKPKLWASERLWVDGQDKDSKFGYQGMFAADWAFGKTDGDVRAITLTATTNTWGQWITDGFAEELKNLGSGSVVGNVDISDPEAADGSYVQKVTTALLAHPDANVLLVGQGGWLSAGLYQAIVQSGRTNLVVVTAMADDTTMDLIRGGTAPGIQLGATSESFQWGAWGSVDTAIRVLAGARPAYIGDAIQAIDADHNLPASGPYAGGIDWRSEFLTAWGKGGNG